jgi:hypothetical protein
MRNSWKVGLVELGTHFSSGAAFAKTRKNPASFAPLIQHLLPSMIQRPLPTSWRARVFMAKASLPLRGAFNTQFHKK